MTTTLPPAARLPLGSAPGQPAVRAALPRLTALRAVAALAVFAYHLGRWDVLEQEPLPIGYAGVAFFFVLSGFVLAWSTPVGAPVATFYRRRLARVYPLHLLCLLLALLVPVVPYDRSAASLVPNLLLVQAWVPVDRVAFGFNGVSWSLSCELAFYLALPLALRLLAPCRPAVRWAWALGWFAVCAATTVALAVAQSAVLVAYTGPVLRSGEFLLGVVAAGAVRSGWRLGRRHALVAALVAAPLVVALPFPGPDVALAPLFLVVVVLAAQADLDGVPARLLTRRWLVYAGEVSFAFYLVHELVLLNLPSATSLTGLPRAALTLVLAALAAVLLHHGVERPARRRLVGGA